MQASLAIEHYQETLATEFRSVAESQDDIFSRIDGLVNTTSTLYEAVGKSSIDGVLYVRPRLSHSLLRATYQDIFRISPLSKFARTDEAQALAFIGGVLVPMSGADTVSPVNEGILCRAPHEGACMDAELLFNDCLTQINTGRWRNQATVSIYHDSEGLPLAFRKSFIEETALTLQPISFVGSEISDCRFSPDHPEVPAGSIVSINDAVSNVSLTGRKINEHSTLNSFLAEEPLAIRPIRLSPWAYENRLDRSSFAIQKLRYAEHEELAYDRDRGRIVEGRTLVDFNDAAARVMAMCGVAA